MVRGVFHPLGFSREEIESFIQGEVNAEVDPAELFRLESEFGTGLARIKRGSTWEISYIIPSDWDERYRIVESAVRSVVSDAQHASATEILIVIKENPPSHNAYFAGMLPLLGFKLTPRAGLAAPLGAIDLLSLPELPDKIREVDPQEGDLEEMVKWYSDSLLSHRSRPISDEDRREGDREMLEGFLRSLKDDSSQAWVVLGDDDQNVALAIGTCSNGGDLTLSQIGVASTHRGMGLGEYVIIRCMQKLAERHGDRGRQFWLRTGRTWEPAFSLYQRLGFRCLDFYSYAQHFIDE